MMPSDTCNLGWFHLMVMLDQEVMIAMPSLHLLDDVHWRQVECQLIPLFEILDQASINTWLTPQLMLNHYDQHRSWQLIRSQQKFTDMPPVVRQPTADQVSIKTLIECQLSLNQDINFHISISIGTCIEYQMKASIGTQLCKSSTLTLSEKMGPAIS